jgi:hypothetical protein
MKTMHYYCPGPGDAIAKPCVLFVYETCLNCEPGLSVACDNTNPSYGSECAPATVHPTTGYYKYQFCDTVCSCGSVAIVEANNMSGEHDYYASITRYNCVPGTAQP